MREPKPWYRKSTDAWYVEIAGKQIRLANGKDNRADATREFHKLMAGLRPSEPDKLTVAELCDLYLSFSEREHAPTTFEWQKAFLQEFSNRYERIQASRIIPFHLQAWLDAHPTWKGGRRHATVIVKRAFAWAKRQGLLGQNLLADFAVPPAGRRNRALTQAELDLVLSKVTDPQFKDFIFALQHTGCRPGEVARVTAADVDLVAGIWTLQQHKTARKTQRPRVIYLTPAMVAMSDRLMRLYPHGPLFRGRSGQPFTANAIRCRFRRLRDLLGMKGLVASTYRATFATNALEREVGIAQVAELLGHTSTAMIMKHYSVLSQRTHHLRQMAIKATAG